MKNEDIITLAYRARIKINRSITKHVTADINNILTLIKQLQIVNTDNVEPISHPLDVTQRLRVDEITENNERLALQAMAPAIESSGCFLVPSSIE